MELQHKRIIITGGARGIGYSLAKTLSSEGAEIYSLDTASPQTPVPGITYLTVDITKETEIKSTLQHINSPIDIVINNAGIIRRGTIYTSSCEDFDTLFGVNVKGSWLIIKNIQPYLSKSPMIVQMSSGHALHPKTNPGLYTLTKQTVVHLGELVQLQYPHYDIRMIFPGPVDTELLRYGRTQQEIKECNAHMPEYLAEKIVDFLKGSNKKLIFDAATWDYKQEIKD